VALQKLRTMQATAKKSEGFQPKDIIAICLVAFMALALFPLAPKLGRELTVVVIILMVATLCYPAWHLAGWVIGKARWNKRICFAVVMVVVSALHILFGAYVWPPLPYYQSLTAGTREDFMNTLTSQKEPKETLIVSCPASNEEMCAIATNYLEMFQRAGWRTPTGGISRGTYLKSFPGVSISKRPEPGNLDPNDPVHGLWIFQSPSIFTIKSAFRKVDIIPREQGDQNLPSNMISIYFGPPPEPER
jgi:hypothetical protein